MSSLSKDLKSTWASWCHLVDEEKLQAEGVPGYAAIHERLSRFSTAHRSDPEHIRTISYVLYRGVPLLLAALGWEEPAAGGEPGQSTPTDQARGDQWRLVMGYGAFETIVKALLMHRECGLGSAEFQALHVKCNLPDFEPLQPPAHPEKIRSKWFQEEAGEERPQVLEFLGLKGGDAKTVRHWLVAGKPADSWEAALGLTKAIRNATAHGTLSANKVREWKLRPILRTLLDKLAQAVMEALRLLTSPAGAQAIAAK